MATCGNIVHLYPKDATPNLTIAICFWTWEFEHQMLIGMAQWACTIGQLVIAFAVSSLSRFLAAPHEHYLELVLHLFGYLKKNPNCRIVLDSRPLLVDDEFKKILSTPISSRTILTLKRTFADNFPTEYGRQLETSMFFDADHAHDHVTHRSISDLIVLVGSTSVIWYSK